MFAELAPTWRGLILLALVVIICLDIYNLFREWTIRVKWPTRGLALLKLVLETFLERYLSYEVKHGKGTGIDVFWVLLLLVVFGVSGLARDREHRRWEETHLSVNSVKEGFDRLPVGMCYYWPGGFPKLVNEAMQRFHLRYERMRLSDGEAFWGKICRGEGIEILQKKDEEVLFTYHQDEAYSLHKREITVFGQKLYELQLINITGENQALQAIRSQQKKVQDVNVHLRDLYHLIDEVTVEKEVLNAKIEVHDRLGRLLLTTEQYRKDPGSMDLATLLEEWRLNIKLFRGEQEQTHQASYQQALEATRRLGVETIISQALPEERTLQEIISIAINVCASNTKLHGKGDRLTVACERAKDHYKISFTNNGRTPKEPLKEGGGLGNLRSKAEAAGGSLLVETAPRFVVILSLPLEDSFQKGEER